MDKYDFRKIEKKWQNLWLKKGVYEPNLKAAKKRPFYNLMMFPYPSAEGLHVGNMYAFVGSDIYGRFQRMKGNDVFEPIGLDGFGIHSENYALKIKAHPMKQAKVSEKRFYKQLQMIGNGFAWKEHLETYDPEYYKWTQWIFTQMFKNGLAYRKKQAVNWCPSCKTVLADEQVVAGECERCGSKVIKKELEQWFLKSTAYAERLLQNLETLDWSEKVKIAQKNWIGKSEGAEIEFEIKGAKEKIKVFTTRPDTLFGATYMVLAPEHPLMHKLEDKIKNLEEVRRYIKKTALKAESDRIAEDKKKTGIELQGLKAINPANKEAIPIWVSDYVLMGYGTGAIMAVPAHDARDFEFAKKFGLAVKKVIETESGAELTESEGILTNSGQFDGMSSERAKKEITKFIKGRIKNTYRLRDWLISRQRYWGAPIPMIYCEHCVKEGKGEEPTMPGWYSVPEKDLPVKLPFVKDFRPRGKGESPLATVKSFYKVRCPACKSWARRETDVSDTFLDSAWYYLRYPNVSEKKRPFSPDTIRKWFPVNMYIGGAEHSVLHLLYVRFLAMALYDLGYTHFEEPMKKFRAHGLLIKEGSKMSKSKGNVVNPDEYIQKFGADTLRMYLMFLAPFEDGGDFRDAAILGVNRFLERVWKLAHSAVFVSHKFEEDGIEKHLHRTIKKVSEDIESLHYNTAISSLMIFLNELESQNLPAQAGQIRQSVFERFLLLLAPFAPHLAEELWAKLGHKPSIHLEAWPEYDESMIAEDNFTLVIQVNGKMRDTLELPRSVTEEEVRRLIMELDKVKAALQGKEPRTIIYVPHRIANIVI